MAVQPSPQDVKSTLDKALYDLGERAAQTEIAFFGGSFTAIDRDYMLSLLNAARPYLSRFFGVRISTRPDYINSEILQILKDYGVTAIELGAQSMNDSVLELNKRGHSAEDVIIASRLIQQFGFSLGLQMMTGLYGATPQTDLQTAEQFIQIRPDTVRIYPTVILRGTDLETLYRSGQFVSYTLDESVDLCARLILLFAKADINVIRLGLHYSDSLVQNSLGNNYHPAFKELCESKIFYDSFLSQAEKQRTKQLTVTIHPKSLSKFLGQKKSNLLHFQALGYALHIQFDESFGKYDLHIS